MSTRRVMFRQSRVLERLRAGNPVSCLKVNLADARVVELAALCGFDCIWTDMEHIANNWQIVEHQILAAKVWDADVLVRVARGSYSDYIRPLELDAAGIMVPHVMNLADARNVVNMTRFQPLGRRPIDGGNADAAYANIDLVEYAEQANDQRFVCLQIEDPEVLADLEAIAALPGFDMLFFGPGDFSHGLGALGSWDDPRIVAARQRVAEVCADNGKFAGTVGTPASLADLMQMGYSFVSLGADVVGLSDYYKGILREAARSTEGLQEHSE